jgi:DMSO reductase anchor subunit
MRREASLIAFTILFEWGAGVFLVAHIAGISEDGAGELASIVAGALTLAALLAALLHLGRPAAFWRAVRNWRTSPLSREVLGVAGFQLCWLAWAAASPRWAPASPAWSMARLVTGWSAAILGLLTIWSVGRLYMATFMPSWRREATWVGHVAAALALGGSSVAAASVLEGIRISSLKFTVGVALAASVVSLLGLPGTLAALAKSAPARALVAAPRPRAIAAWLTATIAFALLQCALTGWMFASGVHATPLQAAVTVAGVLVSETVARALFYRSAEPLLP